MDVQQVDTDMLKVGAEVKVYPLEPGLAPFTTRIENINLVMEPDPSVQKQLLKATALIDNPQGRLRPGAKVDVEIKSEAIPVYELVRREVLKLFNFRKFGIGG